mgnify:CR=1 FL=1
MGRAKLASTGVRGRSDGRVERRMKECKCVQPCADMSGVCPTAQKPCERAVRVASARHAVSASHPFEDSGPWICQACGTQNNLGDDVCFSCRVVCGSVHDMP